MARLESMRAEDFLPHIGTSFRVTTGVEPVVLELAEVYPYPRYAGAPRQDPFGIVFTGPSGLVQRIYRLEHAAMGTLELFLVPIGSARGGAARYEAVFN